MNLQEENKSPEQINGGIPQQVASIKKDHYAIWFWTNITVAILTVIFECIGFNAPIRQVTNLLLVALCLGLLGIIISIICIALKSLNKNNVKIGISIFLLIANILNTFLLMIAFLAFHG